MSNSYPAMSICLSGRILYPTDSVSNYTVPIVIFSALEVVQDRYHLEYLNEAILIYRKVIYDNVIKPHLWWVAQYLSYMPLKYNKNRCPPLSLLSEVLKCHFADRKYNLDHILRLRVSFPSRPYILFPSNSLSRIKGIIKIVIRLYIVDTSKIYTRNFRIDPGFDILVTDNKSCWA